MHPRCRHFHCYCRLACCCDLPSVGELAALIAGRTRVYEFVTYYGGYNGEFKQRSVRQASDYKSAVIAQASHSEFADGARYLVTGPSDASRDDRLPANSHFKDQQGARIFVIRKVAERQCACHQRPIQEHYDFIGPAGGYYRVEEV